MKIWSLVFFAELTILLLTRNGRDFLWWLIFGDAFHRGRCITLINGLEEVVQARAVIRARNNSEYTMYVHDKEGGRTRSVPVNARGITWVYGWSGCDVDALRAQAALLRSAA